MAPRPRAEGKFLFVGDEKLSIRGVTYGTFRANDNSGGEFPTRKVVARDFSRMAANGLNAVRTYTVPPRWLLDLAAWHGVRVLVGVPWEQHVTFLDSATRARSIEDRVRAGVRACAGHSAVLGFAVGNEIPASIVRWYGRRRIERYIGRLYRAAKSEDTQALVTYVNYPTTEYLELPFLDFVCFNVYLESPHSLDAYLARLHNLAGDRPVMLAEIGLDSRRHGQSAQARALKWQLRTAFTAGCAGTFVFAWTDEWHRGGFDIEDWDFGLTTRDRRPKPALAAVREALVDLPFAKDRPWPRISVIVCTYNGSRTIRDCCDGLLRLEYPNTEVIIVNDGSTDGTEAIAREYGFRVISTENRGLSSARNTGMRAATGEIVAYIDDDAWPDPHWLMYLADTLMSTSNVAVGGPNIPPPADSAVAQCVANAPGGPVHVLVGDREAEHIPGCNMAFRKAALEAIGGFDPRFRSAGDDVDVCWRLQERGGTLGFNAAAVVWHHRRDSIRAYYRQQIGYGKAEALLEEKWPHKYNAAGHVAWAGSIYGKGLPRILSWWPERIYQGSWGTAPFQAMYRPRPSTLLSLTLMPEWYLVVGALAALGALHLSWPPLVLALPLLVLALAAPIVQASVSATRAGYPGARSQAARLHRVTVTTFLHLLQPLARLRGRLGAGLSPWRRRGRGTGAAPWPWTVSVWSERWRAPSDWLTTLATALRSDGAVVLDGGEFDAWDLEVRCGALGGARVLMAIEEHGAGRQLLRFRTTPRCMPGWLSVMLLVAALATGAGLQQAWVASASLGATALVVAFRMWCDCAAAAGAVRGALAAMKPEQAGRA